MINAEMIKKTKTRDAAEILNRRFGEDADRRAAIDQIKADMEVGTLIYNARKAAGLTQQQLAQRVGTTQSVISDLESADYEGHSMPMLRRIAAALGMSVQVRFTKVPMSEHA